MTKRDEQLLGTLRDHVLNFMHLAWAARRMLADLCHRDCHVWALACRRWPWFAWLTIGFLRGLLGRRR